MMNVTISVSLLPQHGLPLCFDGGGFNVMQIHSPVALSYLLKALRYIFSVLGDKISKCNPKSFLLWVGQQF